ncbi:hypothetical protein DPSP01_001954 [Paraphaeosphaeria sporulosa]
MSPPNETSKQSPAHRRSSRNSRSRSASLQAQKPRHPIHTDHESSAFFQDYAFGLDLLRPLFPSYCPQPQASRGPGASTISRAVNTMTFPPSNAPREPRAMRQSNPFRGGRRKLRACPELQIGNPPEPPQIKYQQAMAYIDGVVRKTTGTGTGQHIPGLSPTQGPLKMPPPSPIFQELQSNREGGYFSLKPGLRGTEGRNIAPLHEAAQVEQNACTPQQSSQDQDSLPASSSEHELVEAMQGLHLFGNLRSTPHRSAVRTPDVVKNLIEDAGLLSSARRGAEVAQAALSEPAREINASNSSSPDEAVDDVRVTTEHIPHEGPISHEHAEPSAELGTLQTAENLPVPPPALPFAPPHSPARSTVTHEDVSKKPELQIAPTIDSGIGTTNSEKHSFEDIPLDSPTPSSPKNSHNPSVESADSDDDFEVVDTDKYQTLRNGRARHHFQILAHQRKPFGKHTMGFWTTAKWVFTTALDHIEERPTAKQYKLHPDSAYLGNKYYPQETQVLPISTRSIPSAEPPTSTSPPSSLTALAPARNPGSQSGIMQPHVHIGTKAVQTPMRLPEAKYTVLRQGDLVDDDRIDRVVGRERDMYWVVKGAVVLMVRERSEAEAEARMVSVRKLQQKEKTQEVGGAVEGTGSGDRNPLRSPSVEDFFADTFDAGQHAPVDTLPPNPLDKVFGASQPLNPLDTIPWSEMVVVFRRDTKELFVRRLDGKLYPVIWKVLAIHSRREEVVDDSPRVVNGLKFTSVEGEIDAEDYVNVDLV